jgi:hypothetical protein
VSARGVFLAALLAGPSAAAGGSAAARVRAAEDALSAVEDGGCPPGVDVERALRDEASGALGPDAARALDGASGDARLYFACRAYAAGGSAPCAALAGLRARAEGEAGIPASGTESTPEFVCASDLFDMRMARAAMSGDRAAFVAACRAHDAAGHRDFVRGRVEEACRVLSRGVDDPAGACRRLAPLFAGPGPAGLCERELREFSGDESRCAEIRGEPAARELCDGYAAWRRARGGDQTACASSAVCRALDGAGPAACAPLAARALAGVCAAQYAPAALAAASADLDAAEALLASASGEAAAPDAARAADETAERCARARLRLARLRGAGAYGPVDRAFERARAVLREVEQVADGGPEGNGCPPGATLRRYMADRGGKRVPALGDDVIDGGPAAAAGAAAAAGGEGAAGARAEAATRLERPIYYLCRALALKDRAACAEADSAAPGARAPGGAGAATYAAQCARSYDAERLRAAHLANSPAFADLCRRLLPAIVDVRGAAAAEAICRAWRGADADLALFARAIRDGSVRPLSVAESEAAAREMSVAPGACPALPLAYDGALCAEQDDYRAARRASDPARCRGPVCRALMGGGLAACEDYARAFMGAACRRYYTGEYLAARERDFDAELERAARLLGGSEPELEDAARLREYGSRLDALAELRARFALAARRLTPKAGPERPRE